MKGFPPVAVEVPRGRVLMVGSADKVDQTRDGVLLVTDIKTGSARTFMVLNDDPVAAGTKLQLPVYAHMYSIAPETTAEPAAGFDWWTSLVGPAVVAAVVAGGGLAEDRRAQEKRRGDPAQSAGQTPESRADVTRRPLHITCGIEGGFRRFGTFASYPASPRPALREELVVIKIAGGRHEGARLSRTGGQGMGRRRQS